MAEILLDTNSPIKHRLFWKGEPYDSDSLPHVHVYDVTRDHTISPQIDPSTLIATLYAEKVETDFGVYQVFLPLSLTNRIREFKFIWNYDIEGNDVIKEMEVYVTMPYTDITQAIDELGFGTDPSDPNYHTYAELQAAESWARKLIEDATNQNFYPYSAQFNLYGDDSDFLPLPERIITLHSLEENDIVLVDNINDVSNWIYTPQISESNFSLKVNHTDPNNNIIYSTNGVAPSIAGNAFKIGARYLVDGTFGWDEVPGNVSKACIELMGHYFEKDRGWTDHYVNKMSTFDWNFEYNSNVYAGTGCAYADKLLSPYVMRKMMII